MKKESKNMSELNYKEKIAIKKPYFSYYLGPILFFLNYV